MASRREFLQASLASTGGLLVGCRSLAADEPGLPVTPPAAGPVPLTSGPGRFTAYVELDPEGRVFIVCPQSEMGQGVHDGLPKILAEELDADWSRVQVRLAYADDAFLNPTTKRQRTANSDSTMLYYDVMRRIGATAREMLVTAAALRWAVPIGECTTAASRVLHVPSGRVLGYGEIAALAAAQAVPPQPRLKDPASFTLVGRATPRKDTPPKVDGTAVFGIDVSMPGMLHAALRRSDCVVSRNLDFDRAAALARPGVVDAFPIPDGIAVVASSSWLARKAADALEVRFDESAAASVDSAAMRGRMLRALDDDAAALPGRPAFGGSPFDRAAALAAIAAAPVRKEWTYEVPFLAHAALEPLCATAVVREESAELWAPTQQPDRARDALAEITGLPRDRCRVNVTFLGGGFGRKWETDFVRQAAQVALGVRGRPVKLTWSREQDFQHDRYRPAHIARTRVGLAADGTILGMHSRTTGISIFKYQKRPLQAGVADPFVAVGLINDRYDFPNRYTDYVETPDPVPVGTWRSVTQSMNAFFSESALDDIAAATRRDPLALRLELLARDERAVAVLKLAAEQAGWGRKLPKGHGMGIAFGGGFGAFCAEVVEVSVRGGKLKVERIVCAFDCGRIVDPRNVEAQVEGGVVWGLSAALTGQIHFAGGAARETNFDRAPILRMPEIPRIEVHLVRSEQKPGGCGEASVPPVAPALTSAIFAATGRRVRRLPLKESGYL